MVLQTNIILNNNRGLGVAKNKSYLYNSSTVSRVPYSSWQKLGPITPETQIPNQTDF